ncbi:electron transfer flavoprotein subunit alpha/FixB family protein [Fusibacter paucivorans]|uniref:Electron transfer flavoprotein subunit alpha/FixB family protein n=1 Tax=Fusibacter paucivorans TaxID=76009 RepID=A0ABS5PUP4_9FIRM|nr:electron transfer flavoprotein subunit alpha/FixB family protein [Fusibacter paucivorans]MBS7528577.1 electron transfer flavoprotein subunit alpha/FixB family protein [Fusibacter paucivorans]
MELVKNAGIWIVASHFNGQFTDVTYELIGKASELGKAHNETVTAVVIGSDLKAEALYHYGADQVIYAADPIFADFDSNSYAIELEKMMREYKPLAVVFGADDFGRDIAPRLATKLETGLSADCIDLEIKEENGKKLLIQKKPYLNGGIIVDIVCDKRNPQLATVRPGMLMCPTPDEKQSGEVIKWQCSPKAAELLTRIEAVMQKNNLSKDIQKSEIIIAGGRGFKKKEDFEKLYVLADLLGGVVGATRPLVTEGWIDESFQIGQSGKVVSPKLYIGLGISGAAQHCCGVKNTQLFIAVNSDANAPIFQYADYGYVGDCKSFLDELISCLK